MTAAAPLPARVSRPSAGAGALASRWAGPPRRGLACGHGGARSGMQAEARLAAAAKPEGRT